MHFHDPWWDWTVILGSSVYLTLIVRWFRRSEIEARTESTDG
jgi:hypothetical protein